MSPQRRTVPRPFQQGRFTDIGGLRTTILVRLPRKSTAIVHGLGIRFLENGG